MTGLAHLKKIKKVLKNMKYKIRTIPDKIRPCVHVWVFPCSLLLICEELWQIIFFLILVIFCEEIYFNNVFYNFLPYIHKNQMAFSAIQRYLNLQYHKGKYKLIITAHYSGKKGGNAHIAINQCWKYTILGQFLVRCYQSFFFLL